MTPTNLKVVLVGEIVRDMFHQGHGGQDLLAHLVHGSLNRRRVILREGVHSNLSRSLPGGVESGNDGPNSCKIREYLPVPGGVNVGAQDTVRDLFEGSVFISDEPVEGGAGTLEHSETLDARLDRNAGVALEVDLHVAGLGAVAEEGVGVRLAIDDHARPAVRDDLDVYRMDVGVFGREVGGKDGAKELGRSDGFLFGQNWCFSATVELRGAS